MKCPVLWMTAVQIRVSWTNSEVLKFRTDSDTTHSWAIIQMKFLLLLLRLASEILIEMTRSHVVDIIHIEPSPFHLITFNCILL
jgi:hypothetical protein